MRLNIRMTHSPVRAAAAVFVGTVIDWYDFFLYGTAAALVFAKFFFPQFDAANGTMCRLRPLRSVFLRGHWAEFSLAISATNSGGERL